VTDLPAILSPHVTLDVRPDWATHCRPGTFAPVGIVLHHTGGRNDLAIVVNGRPDLAGPLANLYSDRDAPYTITLVSGGRCNHAGAGAQVVLDEARGDIAPCGDAIARGLVDGPVGNGYFYGIEAENLGNGQPWPPGQLEAITHACAALCAHHGWTANRVIGHREWTRRKPDPAGFAMASMRTRIASLLHEEDEMAFTAADSANLEAAKNYLVDQQRENELLIQQGSRIIQLLEQIAAKQ